jgi:Restriction alleviation protein Lar
MNPKDAARQVADQTPMLPCPFCGDEKPSVKTGEIPDPAGGWGGPPEEFCFVECKNCKARSPKLTKDYGTPEYVRIMNAKSAWNQRSYSAY